MRVSVLLLRDPSRQEVESTNKGIPPERALKQFEAIYYRKALPSEYPYFTVAVTGTEILFIVGDSK
jgi:hypothetical protein